VTRPLREVAVADPLEFFAELREALAGRGPALLPRPAGDDAATPELAGARVPDGVALVIETSGSTAKPKRVMLTGAGLRTAAAATHERLGELGGDADARPQWLLCLPGHYIAGAQVLVRSLVAGTTPVVASPGAFTPEGFVADASRLTGERRYVSLVPAQLRRLVDAADAGATPDLDATMARFDAILVGGQATPRDLLARARELGWNAVTTYGSSETSGGAAYNARPLPGVRMRAVDGELWVASPSLAVGYLDDPTRTGAAFVTDEAGERWYRTGDAGTVDETGTVAVTGRFDSVIISGGLKVNLDEVTLAAASTGAFTDVVAVPVASREWGEAVALVAADPEVAVPTVDAATRDATLVAAEPWPRILAALEPLGRAARPALLVRVPELPRLASGKPDRAAVRALADGLAVQSQGGKAEAQ
jgi:O-succinylbenzoic acid--CoA ligase